MLQHLFIPPTESSSVSRFKMMSEAMIGVSCCSPCSDSAEEGCALGRHCRILHLIYQEAWVWSKTAQRLSLDLAFHLLEWVWISFNLFVPSLLKVNVQLIITLLYIYYEAGGRRSEMTICGAWHLAAAQLFLEMRFQNLFFSFFSQKVSSHDTFYQPFG